MLATMHSSDLIQDAHLGEGECFAAVDGTSYPSMTANPRSADATMHHVSASTLPAGEKEKHRYSLVRDDKLFGQLISRWTDKKDQVQATRDEIRKIAQQILLDALASEWLAGDADTAQVRIYVVDHILPTLISGLEKLLVEVEKRDLVETEVPDRNFNPVNFLGQYLMRNNPRYSNFSEASPYIRGLRSVAEQLKQELFNVTEYKYVSWQLIVKCTLHVKLVVCLR